MRKLNRWSRANLFCVKCKTDTVPHVARGLCTACYFEDYAATNPATIQRDKRKWYLANITPEFQKAIREQRNFGGLREKCLERDGYKCVKCSAVKQLVVHHKDGNGRPKPEELKNNTLDNLETLCRACHMAAHRPQLYAIRVRAGFARRSELTYENAKSK